MNNRPTSADEAGFGLVEVIIAFVLLGILFASAAPLMMGALRLSAQAAVVGTASEVANEQLERARASATTCNGFKNFLNAPLPAPYVDARGVSYTISQTPVTAVACPASGASLIDYTVSVTTTSPGTQPKITVETQIWMVS